MIRMLVVVLTILAVVAGAAAFAQLFIGIWAGSGTAAISGFVTAFLAMVFGGAAGFIHDEVDY